MNAPKRVQRKRTKGWKMPADTVYVGRPGKWGNPFKDGVDWVYIHAGHKRKILDPWVVYSDYPFVSSVSLFRDLMMNLHSHDVEEPIRAKFQLMRDTIFDLRGKDLACWCPLDQPCHADVLLELANA